MVRTRQTLKHDNEAVKIVGKENTRSMIGSKLNTNQKSNPKRGLAVRRCSNEKNIQSEIKKSKFDFELKSNKTVERKISTTKKDNSVNIICTENENILDDLYLNETNNKQHKVEPPAPTFSYRNAIKSDINITPAKQIKKPVEIKADSYTFDEIEDTVEGNPKKKLKKTQKRIPKPRKKPLFKQVTVEVGNLKCFNEQNKIPPKLKHVEINKTNKVKSVTIPKRNEKTSQNIETLLMKNKVTFIDKQSDNIDKRMAPESIIKQTLPTVTSSPMHVSFAENSFNDITGPRDSFNIPAHDSFHDISGNNNNVHTPCGPNSSNQNISNHKFPNLNDSLPVQLQSYSISSSKRNSMIKHNVANSTPMRSTVSSNSIHPNESTTNPPNKTNLNALPISPVKRNSLVNKHLNINHGPTFHTSTPTDVRHKSIDQNVQIVFSNEEKQNNDSINTVGVNSYNMECYSNNSDPSADYTNENKRRIEFETTGNAKTIKKNEFIGPTRMNIRQPIGMKIVPKNGAKLTCPSNETKNYDLTNCFGFDDNNDDDFDIILCPTYSVRNLKKPTQRTLKPKEEVIADLLKDYLGDSTTSSFDSTSDSATSSLESTSMYTDDDTDNSVHLEENEDQPTDMDTSEDIPIVSTARVQYHNVRPKDTKKQQHIEKAVKWDLELSQNERIKEADKKYDKKQKKVLREKEKKTKKDLEEEKAMEEWIRQTNAQFAEIEEEELRVEPINIDTEPNKEKKKMNRRKK